MTNQEREDFKKLAAKRKAFAEYLKDEDYRGIRNILIEQYADQAHFIYELLQNADDAEATCAEFILSYDKLLFKHNGARKFTVTDPDNKNNHGDINAITAIGRTNKNEDKDEPVNKIGKFGIGFKAVFQYTDTPAIFDGNFSFRIKDFIVPELLNFDHEERGKDETLFEFPFDKEECPPDKAYHEISEKLKALDCPLLFLSNLKAIKFSFGEVSGVYEKKINSTQKIDRTTAELIALTKTFDGELEEQSLYLFSRQDDGGRNYSVGYFLDKENKLTPIEDKPAFCFFPTKRKTNLNFIIHAPFLLSGSREGILAGNKHNINICVTSEFRKAFV